VEDVNIPLVRKAVPVSIHGQSVRDMVGLVEVKVYERYVTAAGDVSASPVGLVHLVKRDIRDAVTLQLRWRVGRLEYSHSFNVLAGAQFLTRLFRSQI